MHSIGSVLNPREGAVADGWYWQVDADATTLLGIINVDSEEATVEVWLDYYSDGQSRRFDLPQTVIPARGSVLLDLSQFVGSGLPDADGDIIPPGVTFGGYRVWKLASRTEHRLTVESLLVNRRTKTYLPFYNTCCGYTDVHTAPSSISGPVGSTAQVVLFATNSCTFVDEPLWASFSSSNSSVASVNDAQGFAVVSLNSPGTATVTGSALVDIAQPGCIFEAPPIGDGEPGPIVCCGCTTTSRSDSTSVSVKPTIDSISPDRGLQGVANNVTISGAGFGTNPSIQAGTGVNVSINSASNTQISATFGIAADATPGNRSVTVIANGQTSNSKNYLVQIPSTFDALSVSETDLHCPTGFTGFGVSVTYQVRDQVGTVIARSGLTPQEHFTVNGNPQSPGFLPFADPPQTDSSGRFFDRPVGTCYETTVGNPCVDVVQQFNIVVPTTTGNKTHSIGTSTERRDCRLGIRVRVINGANVQTFTLGTVN